MRKYFETCSLQSCFLYFKVYNVTHLFIRVITLTWDIINLTTLSFRKITNKIVP